MFDAALTVFVLVTTVWIYLLLGRVVVIAIRTGRWSMNGAIFDRSDQPMMYYFAIVMFCLFLATMTAASYAVMLIWLGR